MTNLNNYTILNTLICEAFGLHIFSMKLLHNTILTKEIITKFTLEFYDQVISQTNSTIRLIVKVTMDDGIATYSISCNAVFILGSQKYNGSTNSYPNVS